MRNSELRFLQREKHDAEHKGTAMPVDAFLNFLKEDESLSEIQVTAMKEEIRNEVAKACARSIENSHDADALKDLFYSHCATYLNDEMEHKELLEKYTQILISLNDLRYVES